MVEGRRHPAPAPAPAPGADQLETPATAAVALKWQTHAAARCLFDTALGIAVFLAGAREFVAAALAGRVLGAGYWRGGSDAQEAGRWLHCHEVTPSRPFEGVGEWSTCEGEVTACGKPAVRCGECVQGGVE